MIRRSLLELLQRSNKSAVALTKAHINAKNTVRLTTEITGQEADFSGRNSRPSALSHRFVPAILVNLAGVNEPRTQVCTRLYQQLL